MIKKVIAFSARNKVLVLIVTAWALLGGLWAARNIPLDAIPDLSDTQVIIQSRWERSPGVIEDQVTYPIVTGLLGAPKVKAVRAFTDFGYSFVYVIFEDGTDLYWARSRVLEYLSKVQPSLPEGVRTELGPDATSVGWVFQYALVDDSGKLDLSKLRSLQDWFLRQQLQAVPGVAEVASFGGYVKEYQVRVDPRALQAYRVTMEQVVMALRGSNDESGGRLLELSGAEYMVRGRGYARSLSDLEQAAVGRDPATGTPILVRDVARVTLGPALRRGAGELDGLGEAPGGIVIMRHGENALSVIERVQAKLDELAASLPPGVRVVTTYDRSVLIRAAIRTLKTTLIEEMVVVSLIILFFLWHVPSALVPILTIPISVLLAFIPMYLLGVTSNIMSLAGIAISIGVLVDGAIVEVENAYKRLEQWEAGGRKGDRAEVRLAALQEVGPSVFFSLLVIAVAFLPVFALVEEEGRLFRPLALSKTLAMAIAALLAVTLDPAMRMVLDRFGGKYYPEEQHPVSKRLFAVYGPAVDWVLKNPIRTVQAAALAMLLTVPAFLRLGSEFMPPLDEGSLLYMPTGQPGLSMSEAQRLLQVQDRIIKSFPEVERVHGKAGRAETSTDPAPLSMFETVITLKPGADAQEVAAKLDKALKLAGMPNIWTMPIRNRIDMLSTGMRSPVGVKVFGPDLAVVQELGLKIEGILRGVEGTRNVTAERTAAGYYADFEPRRRDLARHGLTVADVNRAVSMAVGGEVATTTVEGRERYGVLVRYAESARGDLERLRRVLVPTHDGAHVPLEQVADVRLSEGPAMIRDENAQLAGYVYIDVEGSDLGGYVKRARAALRERLQLPAGYTYAFSGQYEGMERARKRLLVLAPLAIGIIVLLIWLNTGSWAHTGMVLLAVPFSAIGAVWLMYLLGYNLSVAAWVGFIALLGLDAETGMFMLLYLDLERERLAPRTDEELKTAIHAGAVHRVRPKIMTVACDLVGLLPVMWATGAGSDMMKRVAAPLFGGMLTSFALELLVYPALYYLWHRRKL